jgi:hypothetical protein
MHHSMFLLFGLSDIHNCQFIMDHLLQARNPCPHTATIRQYDTNDFFQLSASSSSPSDDPLSPSSSSLSCSFNWWIIRAPTIQVFCRLSNSLLSLMFSPLASG